MTGKIHIELFLEQVFHIQMTDATLEKLWVADQT